jgi:hypothetical protein
VSGGFHTDSAALAEHASSLEGLAARLDTASRAAAAPFSPDAYGLLCGFLSGITGNAEARVSAAVGRLAWVASADAAGVNGCAASYQELERQLTNGFGGGQ